LSAVAGIITNDGLHGLLLLSLGHLFDVALNLSQLLLYAKSASLFLLGSGTFFDFL